MANVKYILATGSLLFALAGCGGGGSGSNDSIDGSSGNDDNEIIVEKSIGGIWDGTVSSVDGTDTIPSKGIVAEDGRFFFLSPLELDVGTFITSENSFTSELKAYIPVGEAIAIVNGEISGSFIERERISGTSSFGDGTPSSTFVYNYDSSYETPSSLSTITGIYSRSINEGAYTETYTIDASGRITGSDTDGCVISGDISTIDSRFTVYEIQLTITTCVADRNLSGLAAYQSGNETDADSLIIGGDSGESPYSGTFIRQ